MELLFINILFFTCLFDGRNMIKTHLFYQYLISMLTWKKIKVWFIFVPCIRATEFYFWIKPMKIIAFRHKFVLKLKQAYLFFIRLFLFSVYLFTRAHVSLVSLNNKMNRVTFVLFLFPSDFSYTSSQQTFTFSLTPCVSVTFSPIGTLFPLRLNPLLLSTLCSVPCFIPLIHSVYHISHPVPLGTPVLPINVIGTINIMVPYSLYQSFILWICFLSIEFHVLFPFLINYFHILFISIVFRLGSHKLVSCFVYCLSQGISHGMRLFAWGRADDFSFSIIQVHFCFLLIEFHHFFFPSLI